MRVCSRWARSGSKYFSTPSLAGIREESLSYFAPSCLDCLGRSLVEAKARRIDGGMTKRRERDGGSLSRDARSSGQAYFAPSEVTTYSICESTAYMHTAARWRSLNNLDVSVGQYEHVCNANLERSKRASVISIILNFEK